MSKNLLCLISSVLVLALAGFAQAELLTNEDFEAGLESWGVWGSGSGSGAGGYIPWKQVFDATVHEDGTAHGGNKYVEAGFPLGATAAWSWGYLSLYQPQVPVTEGNAYQISVWVRDGDADGATSLIAGNTWIVYEWWVDADTRLDVAGGDYHLAPGSEAIDKSTAEGAPDHDFDGALRPQGATHDIGAYEAN